MSFCGVFLMSLQVVCGLSRGVKKLPLKPCCELSWCRSCLSSRVWAVVVMAEKMAFKPCVGCHGGEDDVWLKDWWMGKTRRGEERAGGWGGACALKRRFFEHGQWCSFTFSWRGQSTESTSCYVSKTVFCFSLFTEVRVVIESFLSFFVFFRFSWFSFLCLLSLGWGLMKGDKL